jgi:predicted phage terminase large subunit-like protein
VLGTQPTGGTTARFIFDNNYFSKTSIGQLIKDNNPGIEIIRQDLLDKDNRPVAPWITHNWVQQRRERIGYRAFMREYMNTPIEEGNVFRPEWVQWKRARPLSEYRKIVAYFDPSFSSRQTADYKAVRVWGLYKDELHCLDSFVRQCTIIDAVQWLYDYYSKAGQAAPVECWMERQFYNDPFQQAVISEGKRRGYRLPLKLDERKKANKKERIEAMAGMYEQGVVFWDARKREQADMQAAYDQLLAFGPGSQAHDDAPDADEGAWAVLLAYARQEAGGLKLGQRRGVMDY